MAEAKCKKHQKSQGSVELGTRGGEGREVFEVKTWKCVNRRELDCDYIFREERKVRGADGRAC